MATDELPPRSSDTIITLPNGISVRRYRLTDVDSLAHHANNKRVWDNLRNRMPHPYTTSDSETWVKLNLDSSKWVASGPYAPAPDGAPGGSATGEALPTNYAICVNGEAVGGIGLDFGDPMDIYVRNAEVGYWLGESHWGNGIMGLVVPAFVDWSWQIFGRLLRINAEPFERNPASRRCLEKAGLAMEGKRVMGCVKNGVFETTLFLGMLRPGMEVPEAK